MQTGTHERWLGRALLLASRAKENGDVPVGALVVDAAGRIIGEGYNRREIDSDPCAHAEMLALKAAGNALGNWNLENCTLVVTLEPCTMCAGAAVQARISRLVFGAWDEKAGACGSVRDVVRDSRLNHQVEVIGGVLEDQVATQLRGFFAEKRLRDQKKDSRFWQKETPKYMPLDQRQDRQKSGLGEGDGGTFKRAAGSQSAANPYRITSAAATYAGPRRSDRHIGRIEVPPLEQ